MLGGLLPWLEPDDWHGDIELHDLWLAQTAVIFVPLATFKEQSVDESPIAFGTRFLQLRNIPLIRQEFEIKPVDGRHIFLSRVALEERGSETGWEGKGTNPEGCRSAVSNPIPEELVSLAQVHLPIR